MLVYLQSSAATACTQLHSQGHAKELSWYWHSPHHEQEFYWLPEIQQVLPFPISDIITSTLCFTFLIHEMVLGSAEFSGRLAQTAIHNQVLCLKLHVKPIPESEDGVWYVLCLHELLRIVKLKISEQEYQNNSNCWGRIHVTEVATTQSASQPLCPFIFCLKGFCFYLSDHNHPEYAPRREV